MAARASATTGPGAPGPDWVRVGAALMALGVALAAFGAHGLEGRVPPARLDTWETGARLHLIHALGLLIVGRLPGAPAAVGWLLTVGVALFSGSLYLLVLLDLGALGAITPLGGLSFIAAWGMLAAKGWAPQPRQEQG